MEVAIFFSVMVPKIEEQLQTEIGGIRRRESLHEDKGWSGSQGSQQAQEDGRSKPAPGYLMLDDEKCHFLHHGYN
ncbi:hypothetical protein SAY87_007253 [Trapa incisa]|uniref:Uncharacterized protein n=1 Tax=Trapa incisa TaxID=236973 RepID=A0AAN7Q065_9MYRT|nr:hypothetical protein SAY87_007253 [Trapa incisa]